MTQLKNWQKLHHHLKTLKTSFSNGLPINNHRNLFQLKVADLTVDFSRQKLTQQTLNLLNNLAYEANIPLHINNLFNGTKVNHYENCPALHTALRNFNTNSIIVDKHDVMASIREVRDKMGEIAHKIRNGTWLGYNNKPITNIINIGIGGSDLGPRLCVEALEKYINPDLRYGFISDADPYAFKRATKDACPENTLFIIASKSFSSIETLSNARKAIEWYGNPKYLEKHFFAVTANATQAQELGIKNILPIWQWVGGRYSLCSAINLISCIALGYDNFLDLLAGAHHMDQHFAQQELATNLPVILALIGIWNINFLQINNLLLLVYAQQIEKLVPYLQQLDMESNGKAIDNCGNLIDYHTAPIIWGGLGNQAQHSYFQLLYQGQHKITTDLLTIGDFDNYLINKLTYHNLENLSKDHLTIAKNHHTPLEKILSINHINVKKLNPFSLGALIALYEHKIYIQGVLWNINSFTQPDVERAKLSFAHHSN